MEGRIQESKGKQPRCTSIRLLLITNFKRIICFSATVRFHMFPAELLQRYQLVQCKGVRILKPKLLLEESGLLGFGIRNPSSSNKWEGSKIQCLKPASMAKNPEISKTVLDSLTWGDIPGEGGTQDFKWRGWSIGGKNQNPKKSLDQKLTYGKSHTEFPNLKNFPEIIRWYSRKKKSLQVWSVLYLQIYSAGIRGSAFSKTKTSNTKKFRNQKFQSKKHRSIIPPISAWRNSPSPPPPIQNGTIRGEFFSGNSISFLRTYFTAKISQFPRPVALLRYWIYVPLTRFMKSFANTATCNVRRVGRQWRKGILNNTGQSIVSIEQ